MLNNKETSEGTDILDVHVSRSILVEALDYWLKVLSACSIKISYQPSRVASSDAYSILNRKILNLPGSST